METDVHRRSILLGLVIVALLLGGGAASAWAHHPARRHHRHHHRPVRHQPNSPLPWMGSEPSPSLFGLNTDLYDTNHALFVRDVPAARGLGARWDRYTAGPKTGAGGYSTLDWEVRQAKSNGMGVILSLGGIPQACSVSPPPANVTACPPTTAGDLAVYEAYVQRLVLHYRNVVDYYESWIEPNNQSNWLTGPRPAAYAALLSAEYRAIQAVNRRYGLHVKLLFGSMIGFSIIPGNPRWIAVLPFTRQVLDDLGGQRPFDGIALLAYRFPPAGYGPSAPAYDYVGGIPPAPGASGPYPTDGCDSTPWCQMTWPQELSAYEQEFADHGFAQQPLWLTEFGWPGNLLPDGGYFPSYAIQAAYLTEAYADLLQLPFVQAAFWFNVRDYQPGLNSPDPSFFYHYGLFNYDLTPKPAALAFKALAASNPGR